MSLSKIRVKANPDRQATADIAPILTGVERGLTLKISIVENPNEIRLVLDCAGLIPIAEQELAAFLKSGHRAVRIRTGRAFG